MQKKFIQTMVLLIMIHLSGPLHAMAHPHVFISQKTAFVFDGKGLAGFRVHWTFDEMFSVMIQEDFDQDHDGSLSREEVAVIKEKAFGYTAKYNYFIHPRIDGKPFDVKTVTQFNAVLDRGRLSYEFFIPCHVTALGTRNSVILSPYDEGYYSAIYFPDKGAVMLENQEGFDIETEIRRDMETLIFHDTVNPMAIFLNFRRKQ